MKPVACKLWPFIPLTKPKYGRDQEAAFEHLGERFYVYVDPRCSGITLGRPSSHLVQRVLPELIELRLGIRTRQNFTTSHLKTTFKEPFSFASSLNITDYQSAKIIVKSEPARYFVIRLVSPRLSSLEGLRLHALKVTEESGEFVNRHDLTTYGLKGSISRFNEL